MPLFGRHHARNDATNVTPKRRGWALFSPYPQRDRTNPNYTNTATRSAFQGRTNDATRDSRRSRRIGRSDARAYDAQPVRVEPPLMMKFKRTLGIQSRGQQSALRQPMDNVVRPRGRGLFTNTPRRVEPQRNRGWFSGPRR